MMILDLVFGCLLLLAGRNLFWLCVGIIGFLTGMQCAAWLGFSQGWEALALSFILGCAGAALAVSFEWLIVVIGVGFLGGGYLLMNILSPTAQQDPYSWLVFVIGGIVGMCLMVIIFDWTLILISALLGATLIVNAVYMSTELRVALFIACMAIGIVVQYAALRDVDEHEQHHHHSLRRT